MFLLLAMPGASFAASSRPACELQITTQAGSITTDGKETVLLNKGEIIEITWDSKNAKKAFDKDGDEIELDGSATSSPKKTTTYAYEFKNGSKEVECKVTVIVVAGKFDQSTLTTMSVKPTISGEVTGSKTVQLMIYKKDVTKPFFTSKVIKTKNGKWNTKITKSLAKGEYTVALVGEKRVKLNTIATSTLTIGKKAESSVTTFVVEPVPLLNGGVAKASAAVPVAYFQVINIGKAIGKVESFSIKQNGSAPTDTIVGFTISDSQSTAVITIKAEAGKMLFKDKVAKLPMNALIGAGQMKLFTIKAILAPTLMPYMGTQLKLDVSAVETNGAEKGVFPVRGTTWTIGY
jgi:hypothetical protein